MAQRVSSGRAAKVRRLAGRYGLLNRKTVTVGACVLVALVFSLALARTMAQGAVTLERQDSQQAEADAGGEADGAESEGAASEGTADDGGQAAGILVHVDGDVANPGVVSLQGESPRVVDAVEAAGGLTEGADTSAINLAAPVEDGSKVHVPDVSEQAEATAEASTADVAASGTTESETSQGKVNLNTASEEELQQLPGVGPATAEKIVEERTKSGPFTSVDDLMRVSGIGEKKLEKLRDYAYV